MKKLLSIIISSAMLLASASGCTKTPEISSGTSITAISSSADKYAKWLDSRLVADYGDILICDKSDAVKYDMDLSGFQNGGYIIRKHKDNTVIAGKDNAGIDAAVRYFAKNVTDADMNIASGEGYKVKSITVDGYDISEYSVYVPDEVPAEAYSENVNFAADTLIKHLKNACGVSLKKTNTLGGRQIIFAYDGAAYGEEAFNIKIADGNITITGGTSRGPLYGAYGFLEECIGYRFLTRGVVHLYDAEKITLESGYDHTEGLDAFDWRDTYTSIDGKTHLYPPGALHSSYKESVLALHNNGMWVQDWLNKPKYGYSEGPESNHTMYKLIPSVGDLATPCFSDEELFEECITNLRIYIESLLDQGYEWGKSMPKISISQNDTTDWCDCSECMATVSQYGSLSSTLIDFIARLNDELIDEYPEIEFWMLSYTESSIKPPKNMDIPDNLTICFCVFVSCNNHHVDGSECNENKTFDTHLNNWFTLTDKIDVWYYSCNFMYSLAPAAVIYQMWENVSYYESLGVQGFFMQNAETTLGFDDLTSYLFAELLWNPTMSFEEYEDLAEEFCMLFYGDGYKKIIEYTKHLEEAGDRKYGCWCSQQPAPFAMYDFDYLSENFDLFIELFEGAIELANTEEQEERLLRLSCHMYYNCVSAQYDDTMANGSDAEKKLLTERYKLLYDRLDAIKDTTMFGVFTDDKLPDTFDPSVNPLEWLSQNNSSWGDMMD